MKNYDRVKKMSVKELAELLYRANDDICFENCQKDTGNKFECKFGEGVPFERCIECMEKWLESECEE